ncbi:MAG: ferritin family protein [Candidatus Omnitrophica bacterium]|nr:ferritin family protein [Candidatus Omnitrophota bacterium]MDD5311334.1 ferritin family protein [Candidatus Omnitrophota bacterium]MDD5546076.1 ferritin family protein [Candidatus Omnitrophota bacterium]
MPKKDLKILQAAIKMEEDGRKFYLKSSKTAKNPVAKKLLVSLADQELVHIERIKVIEQGLKGEKDWGDFEKTISRDAKKKLVLVFRPLSASEKKKLKADPSNLEAITISMEKETKSYDYYDKQSKETNIRIAKLFFDRLKKEEEHHYELLEEAYSLLSDSASWFVKQEGRVMEAG